MAGFQRVGIIKNGRYIKLPNNISSKPIGKPFVHFFPEGEWREMSLSGENVSSKRKLKEQCYKRGMISPYFDIYPRESGYEEEREETARKAEKRNKEETAESNNY